MGSETLEIRARTFGTNKKSEFVQKRGHKSPESRPEACSVFRGGANWHETGFKNTGLAKKPRQMALCV